MAKSSLPLADIGPFVKEVTAPRRKISPYQHELRVTAVSWVGLSVIVVLILAVAHHESSARISESPDAAAMESNAFASPRRVTLPAWLTESEPSIDDVVVARNNIAAAAARHDIARTGAACGSASGAVAKLRQQLPSPEPVLNSTLRHAVDDYEMGLPFCVSATRNYDAAGMKRAARYIAQETTPCARRSTWSDTTLTLPLPTWACCSCSPAPRTNVRLVCEVAVPTHSAWAATSSRLVEW